MRAAIRSFVLTVRRAVDSARLCMLVLLACIGSTACHHSARTEPHLDISTQGRVDSVTPVSDSRASYRRAGLLVGSGDVPFVGSIAFIAGTMPDSTLVLIDLSLSNHALTFTREGEAYHAAYDVVLDFGRGGSSIKRIATHEQVRVGSFRETTRDEESVIYQQIASLPPGDATVAVSIHDAGSTRTGVVRQPMSVPRFDDGTVTAPIPAFRARPRATRRKLPEIVVNPRATAVYGRDSVALFYVEGYGLPSTTADQTIQVRVSGDSGVAVFADTISWTEAGDRLRSALIRVPIARVGFGELTVSASAPRAADIAPQRARAAPLLVSFGDGLPVAPFGEMVELLRFFTSSERLRALRQLAPQDRPKGWTAFLEATDQNASSQENEALRAYLARVVDANVRFREDDRTPGWLTDRGMVFSALGEPDNMIEPNGSESPERSIVQVWDYERYHARFTFVDRAGFGHWRLTASSEAEYHALIRRIVR
jgi:GWxTD domain-containing protein